MVHARQAYVNEIQPYLYPERGTRDSVQSDLAPKTNIVGDSNYTR